MLRDPRVGHRVDSLSAWSGAGRSRGAWVPFHFLPGGAGEVITSRLICQPDSDIACSAMKFALAQSAKPFGLESLGVAAHAYADTFAAFKFLQAATMHRDYVLRDLLPEHGICLT